MVNRVINYLESERLRYRAPEPEDLERLYAWENDSSLWHTCNTLAPLSRYALKKYIADSHRSIHESGQLRLMVELKEDRIVIGNIDLYNFDAHLRKAEVGVFVEQRFQNKGYAKEALTQMKAYAFDFLHLHQLYAYVAVENKACLSLFKNCGFRCSGTLQDWTFATEGFTDVHFLQCINKRTSIFALDID